MSYADASTGETLVDRVVLQCTDITGASTGASKLGSNKMWTGAVVGRGDGLYDFRCEHGETGGTLSTRGSKLGVNETIATKTLVKKVREKTKPGRKSGTYTRVVTRTKDEEAAAARAAGVKDSDAPQAATVVVSTRSFHHEVGYLLDTIYDATSSHVRGGLSNSAGATKANPVGNLANSQLDAGGTLLDNLAARIEALIGPNPNNPNDPMHRQTAAVGRGNAPDRDLLALTNDYMSNVPRRLDRSQMGPSNAHRLVISSWERLAEQRAFLETLRQAFDAKAVYAAVATATTSSSKHEKQYDGLACDIEWVERGTSEWHEVVEVFTSSLSRKNQQWWRNGRCILGVRKVWKFRRNGADARFEAYAKKVVNQPNALGFQKGWHGTCTQNLLGISRSGLLLPQNLPAGTNRAGSCFGLGIYHASASKASIKDTRGKRWELNGLGSSKSMNYTSCRGAYYNSSASASIGYMYMERYVGGTPEVRTSSCWGKTAPDRGCDVIVAVASGNSQLAHDEIVTFHEDAQVFEYLLEVAAE